MINVIGRILKLAALTAVFAVSSYATTFIGRAYISGGPSVIGDNTNDARRMALLYSQETITNDIDTDGDGLSDFVETNTGVYVSDTDTGTDPNNSDSDGDGLSDGIETNTGIYVSSTDTGTDPNNPDSDGDGLSDGAEVNIYGIDPNLTDTDSDGLSDDVEINTSSFSIIQIDTDDWNDAKLDAENRGGRLAILNTEEKSIELTNSCQT